MQLHRSKRRSASSFQQLTLRAVSRQDRRVADLSTATATSKRRDARILIVGAGPFQLDIVRTAKRLVREVWVVDRDPAAPAMSVADRMGVVDFGKPELVLEFARRHGFDGVTSAASDVAVPAVAACVEALGLSGLDRATSSRCRDKLSTMRAIEQAGLRAPATRLVADLESAHREIDAVGGYPAVVKPRLGAGGRGVSIVDDEAGLARGIEKVLLYTIPGEGFLVQQFVSGHSVGVEAFLRAGRIVGGFCLSDQYTEGFVSPIGHGLPSDLDDAAQARVLASVFEFCRALGLSDGPVNFDLRDTADGVSLIEVNPRLGGNSITPLVRTAFGVDLSEATVLAALGEDPSPVLARRTISQPCATRLIAVRGFGTNAVLRHSPQHWLEHEDVLELEVATREGKTLVLRADDWAILGRCLVRGKTQAAAIELAQQVTQQLQSCVTLVPPPLNPG